MRQSNQIASIILSLSISAGSVLVSAQEPVHPPQPLDPELVVPEGTVLPIVLTSFLNSHGSQVGDSFYADTVYPIYIQQRLVIPKGSVVRGTVTQVQRPGRIKGKGRLAVRIDNVMLPNGISRELVAAFRGIHGPGAEKLDRKTETMEGGGSTGVETGQVVGTAAEGAIIGAIADGGAGAGIGAGAGAAVGLATVLFTRGRDLVLEPGTQFDLELRQSLRFAYGEVEFTRTEMDSASRSITPRSKNIRNQQDSTYPGHRGIWGVPWPLGVW